MANDTYPWLLDVRDGSKPARLSSRTAARFTTALLFVTSLGRVRATIRRR